MFRRFVFIVCLCVFGLGTGCDSNSKTKATNSGDLEYSTEGPPKRVGPQKQK